MLSKREKAWILDRLRDGPRGTIMKLHRATGIPHQTLSRWKQDGFVGEGRYRREGGGRK
jgi:hypothetical protein